MALIPSSLSKKDIRKGTIVFSGRFFPNNTAAPTGATGPSYSVATATSGTTFDVTLLFTRLVPLPTVGYTHRLGAPVSLLACIQIVNATNTDVYAQIGTYTPATATTDAVVRIRVKTAATDTAIATVDANVSISFEFTFQDSVVA